MEVRWTVLEVPSMMQADLTRSWNASCNEETNRTHESTANEKGEGLVEGNRSMKQQHWPGLVRGSFPFEVQMVWKRNAYFIASVVIWLNRI